MRRIGRWLNFHMGQANDKHSSSIKGRRVDCELFATASVLVLFGHERHRSARAHMVAEICTK